MIEFAVVTALGFTPPLPPKEFDRPYIGKLDLRWGGVGSVHRECGQGMSIAFGRIYGCAYVERGVCHVRLARTGTKEFRARLKRHEIGHCNGWPGHHPNARN